jgi:hypothetical protein
MVTFRLTDGVATDQETVPITITGSQTTGTGGIAGVVLDAQDAAIDITTPIAGVQVYSLPSGTPVLTQVDGTFSLTGLPPGHTRSSTSRRPPTADTAPRNRSSAV